MDDSQDDYAVWKKTDQKQEYKYFMFPIVQNSRKGNQIHSE